MIKTTTKNLEEMTQKETIGYLNETVQPEAGSIPAFILAGS